MINRLLDGKHLLVVALDHIPLGVMSGWEYPEDTLETILQGHPDYLVLNFGIIKRFSSLLQEGPGIVLRLDGSPSYLVEDWRKASRWDLLYSIDDALRVGASAAIVNILVGGVAEMPSIRVAARVASACLERKLPLIISAIPSSELTGYDEVEVASFAARLAAEVGADIVNSYFDANHEDLRRIVSICPVPVLLSGGSPKSDTETIRRAYSALQAGCVGICFGRSIWQSNDPLSVMQALRTLLDGSQSVDSAIAHAT